MLKFGLIDSFSGVGDTCYPLGGEFLYNWSFACELSGWQDDPAYPATITDNGDGSIHIVADSVWGSLQPKEHTFPAGDYTVRIGVASLVGAGKFSYRVGNTWFTHSPLVLGENIFSFTASGEINNFVVGADNDDTFEADVMYVSMRDTNAIIQLIPCDRSGWNITDSDHYPNYDGAKAFNCSSANGGDCWVSSLDNSFPKYLEASRINDQEKFVVGRLQMKGRAVISDSHMDDRRPDPLVLQGSNDGTIWDEIDRWTGTGPWGRGETKTFDVSDGSSGHSRFRIVWEMNGIGGIDDTGAQMGWIKLFGVAIPSTYVVHQGKQVTYQGKKVVYNG